MVSGTHALLFLFVSEFVIVSRAAALKGRCPVECRGYLSVCSTVCPYVCSSVRTSVRPSVRLSVHPSLLLIYLILQLPSLQLVIRSSTTDALMFCDIVCKLNVAR